MICRWEGGGILDTNATRRAFFGNRLYLGVYRLWLEQETEICMQGYPGGFRYPSQSDPL